ncbi:MAG: SDR family oxidoreductase [Actinobacteria bacterium]|nr:SDR family oxidoreductase [Actinomycetota bacterium]
MTLPFQRALITGASAGIGEEFVHQLSRAGIPCVLVARRGDRLEQLAQTYSTCEVLVADLLTAEGIARVAERLASPQLPIDLLVNNAGFGSSGTFLAVPVSNSTGQIDLNVRALVELSHAALQAFQERKRGYLLNVSSVASFQSGPGMAVYSATKAFVTSFTEALHEELRKSPVRVSALCPGFVRTEFQEVAQTGAEIDSIPKFLWLNIATVVSEALAGMAKGKALIVPGTQYKSMLMWVRLVPRVVMRRVSGKIVGL